MPKPVHSTRDHCITTLITSHIHAGFPSPASDYEVDSFDLNAHLIKNKSATFLFRVRGDSMIDIGIYDNDTLIVDRSITPVHNHIVLAVIDNDYTVKRLHNQNGSIKLLPENALYKPIELSENQELSIWGVVTFNLHKLIDV